MQKIVMILASMVLVGCIETPEKDPPKDPPFQPPVVYVPPVNPGSPGSTFDPQSVTMNDMVDKFVYIASTYSIYVNPNSISIGLDNTMSGPSGGSYVIGRCWSNGRVDINPYFWNSSTLQAREQLVFHELGHCLLGRGHQDQKNSAVDYPAAQIAVSLMNSYHIRQEWYEVNYNHYIAELFFAGSINDPLMHSGTTQFDNTFYLTPSVLLADNGNDDENIVVSFSTEASVEETSTGEMISTMHCDHSHEEGE